MKLKMMDIKEYCPADKNDPIVFYKYPVIGGMFQKRLTMCLDECKPGKRVLDVGFGSGVSFLNLADVYEEIHGIELNGDVRRTEIVFRAKGLNVHLRNGSLLDLPYPDCYFDTVLLVSILEHLRPDDLDAAIAEIKRVLKTGGQMVYGVPVEKPSMVFIYRLLNFNIREHHFSTEKQVRAVAAEYLCLNALKSMMSPMGIIGYVYEVGNFNKE